MWFFTFFKAYINFISHKKVVKRFKVTSNLRIHKPKITYLQILRFLVFGFSKFWNFFLNFTYRRFSDWPILRKSEVTPIGRPVAHFGTRCMPVSVWGFRRREGARLHRGMCLAPSWVHRWSAKPIRKKTGNGVSRWRRCVIKQDSNVP